MRKVFAIGAVNTKRFIREKANLFFVFVFPILIVLMIGSFFGGSLNSTVGVFVSGGGPLADDLLVALNELEDIDVREYATEQALIDGVQRGGVQAGVVIPARYDDLVAAGEQVEIGLVSRPDHTAAGASLQRTAAGTLAHAHAELRSLGPASEI